MQARCTSTMTAAMLTLLLSDGVLSQEFHGLGDLPGGFDQSEGVAVSNGANPVVVGNSAVAGGQTQAFIWTESGGMVPIASGFISSTATDISADGSVVVGWYVDDSDPKVGNLDVAFMWQNGVGLTPLPNLPHDPKRPDSARAHGISADGNTIVGVSAAGVGFENAACAWVGGVPVQLGELGGGQLNSAALAVSSDGSTAVGTGFSGAGQREIRWDGLSPQDLGAGAGPFAVSGDGSVVGGLQGFWTADNGWTNLGVPVRGINDDASIFVGGGISAAIYSPCLGGDELQSFLEDTFGMDFGGWELLNATGISRDGRSIVGVGENPDGDPEGWLITLPDVLGDIDGDGIPNEWECNGIDVDDDGNVDLDLPAMGADPLHKDLFVEVDVMAGRSFPQASRDLVVAAFNNAPVSNPDGTTGINLHILVDDTNYPFTATWATTSRWPTSFNLLKPAWYGTSAERAHAAATELIDAKRNVFRYCVVANMLDTGSLGIAEVDGDDIVVSFGEPLFNDAMNDIEEMAATFMHELGHNLGLRHGGCDNINGKPNYVSIMNYVMTLRMNHNTNFWKLDYSRARFPGNGEISVPIDESDLDEAVGIDSGGAYDGVWMPYGYNEIQEGGSIVRRHRFLRLNGVAADFGRLVPANDGVLDGQKTDSGVEQDLNFISSLFPIFSMSPDQDLYGHNDWASMDITIPVPRNGQYIDAVQIDIPDDELTEEIVAWVDTNLDPPPFPCAADIDGNDTVNVSDLLLLLANWGPCPNPCVADTDNNEFVNVTDLLTLLAGWGPCPDS